MKQKHVKSFDNSKIFYITHKISKDKPSLVFIHGLSGNHTIWKHSLAYFKNSGYNILAVDLCGHGNSFKNGIRKRYSVENFAKDIQMILKKEGIKKPILVGHSLGGMIVLKYDELFPNHADKLVVIASPPANPLKYQAIPMHFITPLLKLSCLLIGTVACYIKRKSYPYIDYSKLGKYNALTILFKDFQTTPLNVYMWTVLSMLNFNIKHHLPNIIKPILLITGKRDFVVSPRALKEINDSVKNAQLEILDAGDHLNPIRRPQQLNKLIHEFIQND